jgi:hypothetical protein
VEADKTLEKEALETYLDGGFNEAAIIRQVRVSESESEGSGSGGGESGSGPGGNAAAMQRLASRLQKYPVLPEPGRQLKAWRPLLEAAQREGGRVVVA